MIINKCSETVVGLEILDGLSTCLRCSLKRSMSRRLVSPMYCLEQWLHCIILSDRFGFDCRGRFV